MMYAGFSIMSLIKMYNEVLSSLILKVKPLYPFSEVFDASLCGALVEKCADLDVTSMVGYSQDKCGIA